jgi:raffinose/stachyose/melibiose transport system permease protein
MAISPFGTRRTRQWIPWASIAIPAVGWLTFTLYPSAATFFYSFTQYSGLPGQPVNYCGLCNYRGALQALRPQFVSDIVVTLKYTAGVAITINVLALALALLLNRRGKSYAFYRAVIFLPFVLSGVVVGGIFSVLLDPYAGPVEKIYHGVFGSNSALLGSTTTALPLVTGVTVWAGTGFSMLIYIAALRNIPRELYEAAALDGAGPWRRFRYITWKMIAPATTVCVFWGVMGTLGDYGLILILTKGNFGTTTLGLDMFQTGFTKGELGYGAMLAIVNFVLTVIIGGGLLYGLRRREVQL